MNISRRNLVFLAAGLVLGLLFFGYYKYVYKEPVNWGEHFLDNKKDPFGTSILAQLLEGISDEKNVIPVKTTIPRFLSRQGSSVHANFIFVGDACFLSENDAAELFRFAKNGNDVFISADNLPDNLNKLLFKMAESDVDTALVDTSSEVKTTDAPTIDTTAYTQLQSDTSSNWEPEKATNKAIADTLAAIIQTDSATSISKTLGSTPDYVDLQKTFHDSILSFSFLHPALGPHKRYRFCYISDFTHTGRNWRYLNDSSAVANDVTKIILGYVQPDKPVFYRFKVGKGYIYYHTLPLTLTNLYLSRPSTLEYANLLFGHLKKGPVYWDKAHHNYTSEHQNTSSKSPLSYILAQPALSWAWYIGLSGILIYLLFFTKRRQRIIPITPALVNSSVEFVKTLALFFRKGSYGHLAEIKARNLRMFIWDRYKISPDLPQEEYLKKVALYSGVEHGMLQRMFGLFRYFAHADTNQKELIEFQKMIEYFYKNCK